MIKKWIMFAALILCIFLLTGCGDDKELKNEVTAEEIKKLLDEEQEFTLIDISTPEQYEEGHIAGAIQIKKDDLESMAAQGLSKNTVIVIYSRSNKTSNESVELLESMEYIYVYNLGKLENWPYDVE